MTIEELRARREDFLEKFNTLPCEEKREFERSLLRRVQSDMLCGIPKEKAHKDALLAFADALLTPKKE